MADHGTTGTQVAILCADESKIVQRLNTYRTNFKDLIVVNRRRGVDTASDSVLTVFASVVEIARNVGRHASSRQYCV